MSESHCIVPVAFKAIPHLTYREERRFWGKVQIAETDQCWPWLACSSPKGYGMIGFRGKLYAAHRVAFFLTEWWHNQSLCVCHRCDNPPCCNPSHLWLGTLADNSMDCIRKGRTNNGSAHRAYARGDRHHARLRPERLSRGEQHYKARLTESDVREIRSRFLQGETSRSLGQAFGVCKSNVLFVVHRKTWKHVG